MLSYSQRSDPQVAAATFQKHLDRLSASPIPLDRGLSWSKLDELHILCKFRAIRADGMADDYFALVGAEYYDLWPPTAKFVDPGTLETPLANSKWWPKIHNQPWGAIHHSYPFVGEYPGNRQLICISFTAEYYMTQHSPPPDAVWKQGKHTVSATITRIADLLEHPIYQGASG